jgi:hypothetical protein
VKQLCGSPPSPSGSAVSEYGIRNFASSENTAGRCSPEKGLSPVFFLFFHRAPNTNGPRKVHCSALPPLLFAIVANTMSNKVWVTWKDAEGQDLFAMVKRLDEGALVDDLRDAFVADRRINVDPATLKVSKTQGGEKLEEDQPVRDFFVIPGAQESAPGTSKSTALVVTFPPPEQQDGKLRCSCCIVFLYSNVASNTRMITVLFLMPFLFLLVLLASDDYGDVMEFVREQQRDARTLVLSKLTVDGYNRAVQSCGLRLIGAAWDVQSAIDCQHDVPVFTWLGVKENNIANRTAYMAHLKKEFTWPDGFDLVDGEDHASILSVPDLVDGQKISGNVDVIIARSVNIDNAALKQNIEAQIELKKTDNKENPEKQVVMQHLAASSLNPDVGVLTLMTDLNKRWHFYWFGSQPHSLMKLVSTRRRARYLLEHMFDDAGLAAEFPIDFLARRTWVQFLRPLLEGIREMDDGENEYEDENQDDGGENQDKDSSTGGTSPKDNPSTTDWKTVPPSGKKGNGRSSRNYGSGSGNARTASGFGFQHDIANELDLMDFYDEEERREVLLRLIAENAIPRMTTN